MCIIQNVAYPMQRRNAMSTRRSTQEAEEAPLLRVQAGYTGARVQISPSPPNINRNSDTKGLRFLHFYDIIFLIVDSERGASMLILAVLWLTYTIYRLAKLCVNCFRKKAIKRTQTVELFGDLCLGIDLLLCGLALNGFLVVDSCVFVIPVAIYLILKIIIRKLK